MNIRQHSKLFPIFSAGRQSRPLIGYMDDGGNTVIEPRYSFGLEFLEGCAPVLVGKKWRYINDSGEQAFAGEFSVAERMSEGRAYATVAPRKFGFVDVNGRVVVQGKYRLAAHFSEGRALVYVGGSAGFIDTDGSEIVSLKYEAGTNFSEGLAAVKQANKWGYIESGGSTVIPFQFELPWVSSFRNGLAAIPNMNGKTGFIDRTGAVVIEPRFKFAYGFTEGVAAVETEDGWAYIDTSGERVINQRFGHAYPFSEGLAAVAVGDGSDELLIGFIDRAGEFVVPPRFTVGLRFHDGICWTETRETCGYINRRGEEVWQCPWVKTDLTLRL